MLAVSPSRSTREERKTITGKLHLMTRTVITTSPFLVELIAPVATNTTPVAFGHNADGQRPRKWPTESRRQSKRHRTVRPSERKESAGNLTQRPSVPESRKIGSFAADDPRSGDSSERFRPGRFRRPWPGLLSPVRSSSRSGRTSRRLLRLVPRRPIVPLPPTSPRLLVRLLSPRRTGSPRQRPRTRIPRQRRRSGSRSRVVLTGVLVLVVPGVSGAAGLHAVSAGTIAAATSVARPRTVDTRSPANPPAFRTFPPQAVLRLPFR